MEMADHREAYLVEIFGEENLDFYQKQDLLVNTKVERLQELCEVRQRAADAFKVHLSWTDVGVSAASGVLLGIGNALFKDFIPQHGPLAHTHGTTRSGVDYGVPKPPGLGGSVNDLHRQIGPGHDIFRFKEALGLMKGESSDFNLWGHKATEILGHELKPGNLPLSDFRDLGGFRIPDDPRGELINHLLIDFFTKRSLPIPGSSYLADSSPEMAKGMLVMYKNGLNLKTAGGNLIGYTMVQVIIHGYTFLFKAIPASEFSIGEVSLARTRALVEAYLGLIKKNEFHVMMIISHGASFLADTLITCGSKSYAGLLQLNYLSLMAFSKHLLQYLLQSASRYNDLIAEAKELALKASTIDFEWEGKCRLAIQGRFADPAFLSILDKDEWAARALQVYSFQRGTRERLERERELLRQLEE